MNLSQILATGTLMSLTFISPAWSHAHLDRAAPAEHAREASAPEGVTLTFSQEVELNLSSIKVTNGSGETIATGSLENVDGSRKSLRVTLPKLAPGAYKVEWSVTSVDTHRTSGDYTFTVAP